MFKVRRNDSWNKAMAGNKKEEWRLHLRIVREVVPPGEKAGREENNQKKEEMCGKSDVSGGQMHQ